MGSSIDCSGGDKQIEHDGSLTLSAYPVTITGWFRANSQHASIVLSLASTSSSTLFAIRTESSGALSLKTYSYTDSSSGSLYSTDTWHHIAAVFRSATDRELYLDGVSIATGSTSETWAGTTDSFGVGANPWGGGTVWFNGQVAAPQLYTKSLSNAEILEIMYNPSALPDSLYLYWTGLENIVTDSDLVDLSGNGFDSNSKRTSASTVTSSDSGPPIYFPTMEQ